MDSRIKVVIEVRLDVNFIEGVGSFFLARAGLFRAGCVRLGRGRRRCFGGTVDRRPVRGFRCGCSSSFRVRGLLVHARARLGFAVGVDSRFQDWVFQQLLRDFLLELQFVEGQQLDQLPQALRQNRLLRKLQDQALLHQHSGRTDDFLQSVYQRTAIGPQAARAWYWTRLSSTSPRHLAGNAG